MPKSTHAKNIGIMLPKLTAPVMTKVRVSTRDAKVRKIDCVTKNESP